MQCFNIFFLWLLFYLTQLCAFILAYAVVYVFVPSNYKANKQEYYGIFTQSSQNYDKSVGCML